jgi:very-short-patch-repair endonuclease
LRDRWEVPEGLRRRMVEVARQFRKEPTRGEAMLWRELRRRGLNGRKVRRQQPIGPFIVDFFVPAFRLVIEVDGPIHQSQQEADRQRQELLESLGLRILRLPNADVENDPSSAVARVRASIEQPTQRTSAEPSQ